MAQLAAIAACSIDRVVGNQGQIPWHSPRDLSFFKKVTENSILIMGRKTLESLPGLLPKRIHIVVTSHTADLVKGNWYQTQLAKRGDTELFEKVKIVNSTEEALTLADQILLARPNLQPYVYIAGGGQIYQQMLPKCSLVYLTLVTPPQKPTGDAYFPELEPSEWRLWSRQSLRDSDIGLEFRLYLAQGSQSETADLERFAQSTEFVSALDV